MSKAIIHIDETLCKGTEGCKLCISFCPREVLGVSETLTARAVHPADVINEEDCTACQLCMLYCPDLAITVQNREEDEENV
ncbi:TPA: ferredoxin [Candidatus Poribacteria bacterium]|nr:ferredoxin [Candidatus Poribacteria bacterium]